MYEEKLKELGLEVPQMAAPVANYMPRSGKWLALYFRPTSHGERPTRSGRQTWRRP